MISQLELHTFYIHVFSHIDFDLTSNTLLDESVIHFIMQHVGASGEDLETTWTGLD